MPGLRANSPSTFGFRERVAPNCGINRGPNRFRNCSGALRQQSYAPECPVVYTRFDTYRLAHLSLVSLCNEFRGSFVTYAQ